MSTHINIPCECQRLLLKLDNPFECPTPLDCQRFSACNMLEKSICSNSEHSFYSRIYKIVESLIDFFCFSNVTTNCKSI